MSQPAEENPVQMLRIVDLIDCVAGNAPNKDGDPISMITFAWCGELDQTLALSFNDTKLLVVKLLQSLADNGNEFAEHLLEEHFTDNRSKNPSEERDEDGGDDEGEEWKGGKTADPLRRNAQRTKIFWIHEGTHAPQVEENEEGHGYRHVGERRWPSSDSNATATSAADASIAA